MGKGSGRFTKFQYLGKSTKAISCWWTSLFLQLLGRVWLAFLQSADPLCSISSSVHRLISVISVLIVFVSVLLCLFAPNIALFNMIVPDVKFKRPISIGPFIIYSVLWHFCVPFIDSLVVFYGPECFISFFF